MKRVLIVSVRFPPLATIGAQRYARLSRHLPAYGWEPIVLTLADGCALPWDETLLELVPPELKVHRAPCRNPHHHSSHYRNHVASPWMKRLHIPLHWLASQWNLRAIPDGFIAWRGQALEAAEQIQREVGFDAALGCMNPSSMSLIAEEIGERYGVPYLADARDPWTLEPGFEAKYPARRVAQERELERRMLANAAGFIANTIGMEQLYLDALEHELRGKTVVVNNSFDPDEWQDIPRHTFHRFTILHGGNIHQSRSLQPVMRALALLKRRGVVRGRGIQLVQFGLTPNDEQEFARQACLGDWVRFEAPVPRETFTPYLCGAHLLLVTERLLFAVPGKTFDYLGSGRPILAVAPRDGDIARVVRTAGQGFVVEEDETEALADTILGAYQRWSADLPIAPSEAVGDPLRYSSMRTAAVLAGLLDRVTSAA